MITQLVLTGAMTDPCPVCQLKPVKGVNLQGIGAEPTEGAFTVCFGCGLIQIVHDGMRCALTDAEADWVYNQIELVMQLLAISKLRAKNPLRTGELVREQTEQQ